MDETEFIRQALSAIDALDFEAIENLRDFIQPTFCRAHSHNMEFRPELGPEGLLYRAAHGSIQ